MGASISNTRGLIRYSRTETKKLTFSEANTKYDLFEATSDCLIKISHPKYSGGMYDPNYYVNNEATSFASSNSSGGFSPNKANKYSLTPAPPDYMPYEMIALLQKGDKLKVSTSNTASRVTSLSYTILIYE